MCLRSQNCVKKASKNCLEVESKEAAVTWLDKIDTALTCLETEEGDINWGNN